MLNKQIETLQSQLLSSKSVNQRVSSQAIDQSRRSMRQLSSSRPPLAVETSKDDLEKIASLQEELARAKETIDRSDIAARNHLAKISSLEEVVKMEQEENWALQRRFAALEEVQEREKKERTRLEASHALVLSEQAALEKSVGVLVEKHATGHDDRHDLLAKVTAIAKMADESTDLKAAVERLEAEILAKTSRFDERIAAAEESWRAKNVALQCQFDDQAKLLRSVQSKLDEKDRLLVHSQEEYKTTMVALSRSKREKEEKDGQIGRLTSLIAKWQENLNKLPREGLSTLMSTSKKNQGQAGATDFTTETRPSPFSPRRSMQL